MDFSINEKVVVVNGGLGLLGGEISKYLARSGASVIVGDINKSNGVKFEEKMKDEGFDVNYIKMDTNNPDDIQYCIDQILENHKQLDGWVNVAYPRTNDWGLDLFEISNESFNKNLQLHLGGYFLSAQKALYQMKRQKSGSMIMFGSIYGVQSPHFNLYEGINISTTPAYSAIKGGIAVLGRYLAGMMGKFNVRVNTISPGGILDNQDPTFVHRYNELVPMKRMGKPSDIAPLVRFLISDESSYITGQNILVDGGWTIW